MINLKAILINGLKTGFALATATTAAIMLASDHETGHPWEAVNTVCHIIDGDDVTQPSEWSPRHSLLGMFINGTAMSVWGVLYEGTLAVFKIKSNPLAGALFAVSAYVIDYRLVPKRFTPGIEQKLSHSSVLAVYLALGTTFGMSSLWNKKLSP